MIEYWEVVHLLTKDEYLLERYSKLDSEKGADYLLNEFQQDAHTTLEILSLMGEKQSKAYERTHAVVTAVEYFYYSQPFPQRTKLIKDIAKAIRLYKLGRLI